MLCFVASLSGDVFHLHGLCLQNFHAAILKQRVGHEYTLAPWAKLQLLQEHSCLKFVRLLLHGGDGHVEYVSLCRSCLVANDSRRFPSSGWKGWTMSAVACLLAMKLHLQISGFSCECI